MNDIQREAFEAVERINKELAKKYRKKDDKDLYKDWRSRTPTLSVGMYGRHAFVNISIPYTEDEVPIPEISLFNTHQDDRRYYEKSDKYESVYSYVKRRFRDFKSQIESIKL